MSLTTKNNLLVYNAVPPSGITEKELRSCVGIYYGAYAAAKSRLMSRGFLAKTEDGLIAKTKLVYTADSDSLVSLTQKATVPRQKNDDGADAASSVTPSLDNNVTKQYNNGVLYVNPKFVRREYDGMKITGWFNSVTDWEDTVRDNIKDAEVEEILNGYRVILPNGEVQQYKYHADESGDGVVFR